MGSKKSLSIGVFLVKRRRLSMGLLLLLFLLNVKAVSVVGNGNLKLNTAIITNEQIQTGGGGEFPIRGILFSKELNEQAQQNDALLSQQTDVVGKLDFQKQSNQKADMQKMKAMLFQDYNPQVILSKSSQDGRSYALYVIIGALAAAVLLVVGVLSGRWWARRGRTVRNDRNHTDFKQERA